MTLTPEQKAEGWIEWGRGERPIKDARTIAMVRTLYDCVVDNGWDQDEFWHDEVLAYRIIEAHGADAAPARPTPATGWLIHKAGRGWYRPSASGYTGNVADAGRYSYEDALRRSHPNGMHGPRDGMTIKHESEIEMPEPPRPTPFPASYDDLVFDATGWSQTIIVDGKRPEWLRDDDLCRSHYYGPGPEMTGWYPGKEFWRFIAIRVRRREPKRETVQCQLSLTHDGRFFYGQRYGTIDLIDGKPDLSTLKIAEGAL